MGDLTALDILSPPQLDTRNTIPSPLLENVARIPAPAPTQCENIENILQKLPMWKVLQLTIPNDWKNTLYSVIYWKVDWDDLILTLSKNDWEQRWHYKTLVVPKNTVLTDKNLPYTAWYDQWVRKDTEESKILTGVEIISPTDINREPLSTYLASVTPTSPVVLSTINRHSDENSRRDFTIIWARKIGDTTYDLEIIRDSNDNRKQVRAKVTWTPWSEKIEFEGEYTEPWFLRRKLYKPYKSSAIRYITKVQLWMAKKPSLWEKTREKFAGYLPKKNSSTQSEIKPASNTVWPNENISTMIHAENHDNPEWNHSIDTPTTIIPAIQSWDEVMLTCRMHDWKNQTITLKNNLTNDTESNYRFVVHFWTDKSNRVIMVVPKSEFSTIWWDKNINLSFVGQEGVTTVNILNVIIWWKYAYQKTPPIHQAIVTIQPQPPSLMSSLKWWVSKALWGLKKIKFW